MQKHSLNNQKTSNKALKFATKNVAGLGKKRRAS